MVLWAGFEPARRLVEEYSDKQKSPNRRLVYRPPGRRVSALAARPGRDGGRGARQAARRAVRARSLAAAASIAFCSFSNARASIWRTRSRDTL
jgi:hypothetical protein